MYFYILCTLLFLKATEPSSTCNPNRQNHAINTFNSLSNDIIVLDQKVQDTCKQFPTFAAWERFGGSSYRLEVMLPEFHSATFVVKIKHRLIYINGHYPQQGQTCDLTYVDIKVLPTFVDPHRGAWTYINGKFIVAFPYSQRLKSHESTCSTQYIDETIILPRRGFPTEKLFSGR